MHVSIIIPTHNRVKSLEETLNSVVIQTKQPKEVIIVDDSDNNETEHLIEYRNKEFEEKGIFLKYIRNKKEKSSAIARNIGMEKSVADILLFLDDDVILDKNYIMEILSIYEKHPNALGVQGYITNIKFSNFWNRIYKTLFLPHLERDKCRVLPSTNPTYPYLLDKVISCQWLSGSNSSFKREVFTRFRYNENLKRYSYKEDVDLSYTVFKAYPNSLYITPHAKLIHKSSEEGRLPDKLVIHLKHIYILYFFYKHIDQNFKNKLIFIWCWGGHLILIVYSSILRSIMRGSRSEWVAIKHTISAYISCMNHLNEIKEGNLTFFNKTL